MLNHITLMGRLTRDPELRYTQSQTPVASFTLACDRDFGGRDGSERQTDFIDCVAWRQTAEFVSKYFSKGRLAAVDGRLQIREWTDKDGNKRRSAEIAGATILPTTATVPATGLRAPTASAGSRLLLLPIFPTIRSVRFPTTTANCRSDFQEGGKTSAF